MVQGHHHEDEYGYDAWEEDQVASADGDPDADADDPWDDARSFRRCVPCPD